MDTLPCGCGKQKSRSPQGDIREEREKMHKPLFVVTIRDNDIPTTEDEVFEIARNHVDYVQKDTGWGKETFLSILRQFGSVEEKDSVYTITKSGLLDFLTSVLVELRTFTETLTADNLLRLKYHPLLNDGNMFVADGWFMYDIDLATTLYHNCEERKAESVEIHLREIYDTHI